MASPVLSINAFGLFELHVSCQDQEDGAGWRRWGLYPHLLVLSAAWETHGQDLQRGNFAPFSGDLLTSLESIIYLRPTSCYPIPCSAFSHFSPGHYFSLHEPAEAPGSSSASMPFATCPQCLTSSAATCLSVPGTTCPTPSSQAEEMQAPVSIDKQRGLEIVCPGEHRLMCCVIYRNT